MTHSMFRSCRVIAALAALLVAAGVGAPVCAAEAPARTARVTVDLSRPGPAISPMLHGLFFEDINYAADGGLYAELVQNRSFEHRDHLYAWSEVPGGGAGRLAVATDDPLNAANPHYLRVEVTTTGYGVANSGYGGIPVRQGERYRISVRARSGATAPGGLVARLVDGQGRSLGEARLRGIGPRWARLEGVIQAVQTATGARLVLVPQTVGRYDLDVVSLFPENTWGKRRNGLRADLVRMLAEMRPGFLRFPGGCIVEGFNLANAYRWKDTVGDIAERRQNWNRWQDPRGNEPTRQYYQTYGLGFFEYFQLCEDIGAEAVPVLNCGMACQFQTSELVPLNQLAPWVQDALDLIEFANGPVTSRWGRLRAAMGHPRPFRMKYLAVGNEQWGEAYIERYRIFYNAIKARHPEITIITTSGAGVDDAWWSRSWSLFRAGNPPAQIVDEHYYRPPDWFLEQAGRYDRYQRSGPKVFAGEYAAHGPGRRSDLRVAMTEAAFMTGLVRNADVVKMASYAPLFARMGATQWQPNLIWFDNTRVYGTPSYYVQALFSRHRGDVVLPTTVEAPRVARTYRGMIGVGTWATQAEFRDIRVTKAGKSLFASDFSRGTAGWQTRRGMWEVVDGALRQTGTVTNARALAGDPSWTDYTLTLKARKLGGSEGFLILFQHPGDQSVSWWNLGGWGNTQHGIEAPGVPAQRIPGQIETGRWYDIRIELEGPTVRCYLDGQLLQQATRTELPSLYAVASRENRSGEAILKVVNPSAEPVEATVQLQGAGRVATHGRAIVLTAETPDVENTLEAPTRVVPREQRLTGLGREFRHRFPAHSLTVLRLRARR